MLYDVVVVIGRGRGSGPRPIELLEQRVEDREVEERQLRLSDMLCEFSWPEELCGGCKGVDHCLVLAIDVFNLIKVPAG